MKELNGRELAGFVKERQAQVVRNLRENGGGDESGIVPKLVIIRDSDNPVITKYVELKKRYGEDIGVEVADKFVDKIGVEIIENLNREIDGASNKQFNKNLQNAETVCEAILAANIDPTVSGIIVQLPLKDTAKTDEVVGLIAAEKDVDGLAQGHSDTSEKSVAGDAVADASGSRRFESATATAITWLLTGYNIDLTGKKIALVGRGRLVGAPLLRMWTASGLDVTVFRHDSNLAKLSDYDIIVTATGVPGLIKSKMIKPGAVVVDAGTASEDGVLVGDVDEAVRERTDLAAITPKVGGVGPLTVSVLFENVIAAAQG